MLIIFSRKLILKYYIARFELLIFKVERSFQMARSASAALCRAGAGGVSLCLMAVPALGVDVIASASAFGAVGEGLSLV